MHDFKRLVRLNFFDLFLIHNFDFFRQCPKDIDQEQLWKEGKKIAKGINNKVSWFIAIENVVNVIKSIENESRKQVKTECKDVHNKLAWINLVLLLTVLRVESDFVDTVTKKWGTDDLQDASKALESYRQSVPKMGVVDICEQVTNAIE